MHGGPVLARIYRGFEPRWRRRLERHQVTSYDDREHGFRGGDLHELTTRVYEKGLRHIWKAEIQAPFLGFHDASALEKAGVGEETQRHETRSLLNTVSASDVRREFDQAFSPEQRQAILDITSLIAHGEAYALYTSATLLPFVSGTGSKMGMAMQVMEEAKHFLVLREMTRLLGGSPPLRDSAYILFERIARAEPYARLFGMNVILESWATSLFAQFAEVPGLRHVFAEFHLDESRHVGFPKNYYESGRIPPEVTHGLRPRMRRERLLFPAIGLIWDYKPAFDTLGIDVFAFFGRFLAKASRLAENSGLPIVAPREKVMALTNLLFNSCVRAFEPERFNGYQDYTQLHDGSIRSDILEIEKEVFGEDVFSARPAQEAA